MAKTPLVKGRWFGGDRTIEQQLMGLDRLWREILGKTVLDVGCAEGEISLECAKRGAKQVVGIEIRRDAVTAAQVARNAIDVPPDVTFMCGDAQVYVPFGEWDIVLLLAVLHKLKDPSAACRRLVAAARDLVVIRLPPATASVIVDERSGNEPHDIGWVMADSGFELEHQGYDGPFGEWMGYYRRIA